MDDSKADTSEALAGESVADRARRLAANRKSQSVANSELRAKVGSTAGKNLGGISDKDTGMPKAADYPSTNAWMKAMGEWRRNKTEAKEKALGSME